MANHTTLLVILSVVLSIVTTARCSWISGGAPPPVSEGDYVTLDDDDTSTSSLGKEVAPAPSEDIIPLEREEFAPASNNDIISLGKDELAFGPSGDIISLENKELAPDDFIIQGKSSIAVADGPTGDLVIQDKEKVDNSGDNFIIQGKVYCDPCRIQFPTKLSFPLRNTKISLVCHKEETGETTYTVEGLSDEKGKYTINAVGDHANEICEITVAESPDPNCPELMEDENNVRVSLTNKHGIKGKARFANPLGFMATDADPRCKEALDELGFTGI